MNDMSETLLQSMQIIAESAVKKLEFDKTIICQIIDDTSAALGVYTVSDGVSSFRAYSENTEYTNQMKVYVVIPQGDYSKQKLITGKYTSEDDTYYNYIPSMKNFINVTQNLIPVENQNNSLLANGSIEEKEIYSINFEEPQQFTTLAIQAGFMTWLSELNIVAGDYGIRVELEVVKISPLRTEAETVEKYNCIFNCSEMYGNPYGFSTYFSQEKLFAIDNLGKILSLKAFLYQRNNFTLINRELYTYPTGSNKLLDNISVNNLLIAFGFNRMNFEADTVLLYSPNTRVYSNKWTDDYNKKVINASWIHFLYDEEDNVKCFSSFTPDQTSNYCLHWYRYILNDDIYDDLAGAFWEEILLNKNQFTYHFVPNSGQKIERIKVVIEELNPLESDESGFEKSIYSSDVIEFTNANDIADIATVDLVKALTIECDTENYNGVFYCYDDTNELKNSRDASEKRILRAVYNSALTGETSLDTAESISWKIPLINTMIAEPQQGTEYDLNEQGVSVERDVDGRYVTITREALSSSGNIGTIFEKAAEQLFRIKPYFSANATNNIVYCIITKNNMVYETSYTMQFGTSGLQGTGYSIYAEFDNNIYAITDKNENEPFRITVNVYNPQNLPIEDLGQITYKWSSCDTTYEDNAPSIFFCDKKGNILSYNLNTELKLAKGQNEIYLLKNVNPETIPIHSILTISVEQEIEEQRIEKLTKSFAIPYSKESYEDVSWVQMQGPTRILYNSGGTEPTFLKEPYKLLDEVNNFIEIEEGYWFCDYVNAHDQSYAPSLRESTNKETGITNYNLKVPSLYVDGLSPMAVCYAVEDEILWAQPLLIEQKKYTSDLLNSWNGDLTLDEKKGIILSAMMGAGVKNKNNTFSGVLMGDCTLADSSNAIGLYGYNENVQSFGFKVDGTAFIGKPNLGQIQINGNGGTIQSGAWQASGGTRGTFMDLRYGVLDMKVDDYWSEGRVLLNTQSSGSRYSQDPYFLVTSEIGTDLIYIDNNNYFLQSDNFSSRDKTGTKINLSNGKMEFYANDSDNKSSIEINANASKSGALFKIAVNVVDEETKESAAKTVLFIGPERQYIQSANYSGADGTGTNIDLMSGKISLYSTDKENKSKIMINPNAEGSQAHFSIVTSVSSEEDEEAEATPKTLLFVGPDRFYLQSKDYASGQSGTKIDLANGLISSYNFNLNAILPESAKNLKGSYIKMIAKTAEDEKEDVADTGDDNGTDVLANPAGSFNFEITLKDSTAVTTRNTLLKINPTMFYMHSPDWVNTESSAQPNPNGGRNRRFRGVAINLNTSSATFGSKFTYNQTSPTLNQVGKTDLFDSRYVKITSESEVYPVQVIAVSTDGTSKGRHLGVRLGWSGAISINQHYYFVPTPIYNYHVKIPAFYSGQALRQYIRSYTIDSSIGVNYSTDTITDAKGDSHTVVTRVWSTGSVKLDTPKDTIINTPDQQYYNLPISRVAIPETANANGSGDGQGSVMGSSNLYYSYLHPRRHEIQDLTPDYNYGNLAGGGHRNHQWEDDWATLLDAATTKYTN